MSTAPALMYRSSLRTVVKSPVSLLCTTSFVSYRPTFASLGCLLSLQRTRIQQQSCTMLRTGMEAQSQPAWMRSSSTLLQPVPPFLGEDPLLCGLEDNHAPTVRTGGSSLPTAGTTLQKDFPKLSVLARLVCSKEQRAHLASMIGY